MGFWDNIFSRDKSTPLREAVSEVRSAASPTIAVNETDERTLNLFGLSNLSSGGVAVTQQTALSIAAVYACVNDISQDIAGIPCQLFRDTDAGKEKLSKHPALRVLNIQASPLLNSYHLRQSLMALLLLRGNAYARIERNGGQRVVALHYKHPDETSVFQSGGRLWYRFSGDAKTYSDFEVLHLRGLTLDGVMGVSVLHWHRETFGKELAASRAHSKFYQNGAKLGGALESDKTLSKEAAARLRENFMSTYSGTENAGKVAILEEGLKFKSITLTPADADYINTHKLTRSDIASIFRMPPHKIGDLERSTNNNIEQQSLDYVGDTLMPWLLNMEQEFRLKLLSTAEIDTTYFRHNLGALLRADAKSRAEYYTKMIQNGVYSINEVRSLEELNPAEGGERRFVQVNMMPLDRVDDVLNSKKALPTKPTTDNEDPAAA